MKDKKEEKLKKNISISEIENIINNGGTPVCPYCNENLVVALDRKTANNFKVHPGVYCPKPENHPSYPYFILISLSDTHREMRALFREIGIGKEKE